MLSDFPLHLVLASSSKYRKELLMRLGLPFTTASPEIDETPLATETPAETALRLACQKAKAIGKRFPDAVVIGSDQVAECDGEARRYALYPAQGQTQCEREGDSCG